MIVINILWAPLIVTAVSALITYIVNGFEDQPQNDLAFGFHLLTGILGFFSFIIYVALGIYWLFTHIKFTT
jgi:membrane protein insertase Oxa1/YidC/SpoIIIJ